MRYFILFILAFLLIIYRPVVFGQKIVFPSNFLASFYSPWSTQKFPGWDQGIPHKPIGADMLRFFYPGVTFSLSEIKAGRLPLWDPHIFSGNPHLANFQSAVFYPLNLIYLILPQLSAWNILIITQPLLAATFAYLFLNSLKVKRVAAAMGAFAFGFSGYIITWSQEAMAVGHSVIWLPLALFGIEKKKYWVTVMALTFSILAGYLQTTIYVTLFVISYAIYKKIPLLKIFIVCLLAVSLSAIQVVPAIEGFSLSARPTATIEKVFDTYLLPISHLVKTIAPNINGNPAAYNYFGKGSYNETVLYIGVVPLVFALYALRKRKESTTKFFLIATGVTFLLTSDFFLTRIFLHLPLPLIPTFQPSRILILTTFSLATLSTLGLSTWIDEKKNYRTIITISILFTISLVLSLIYLKFNFLQRDWLVAVKNCALPLLMIGLIAMGITRPLRKYFLFIVITLTVIGQFYFFDKYLTLGDKEFLYPDTPISRFLQSKSGSFERFIAFGEPIYGDFSTQLKVYSPEGYDPIFSKRYGQLIYAGRDFMDGKLSEDIPRIEVMMSQIEKNPQNFRRSRLLSLLGIKDILKFDGDWQITKNPDPMPRTFLVGNYVVENNPQKIFDMIFDSNFNLEKTLILEKKLPAQVSEGAGSAKILVYEPTRVIISATTTTPQLLFLSDNYYPGWKATVDYRPSEIFLTDYSFRSVLVPTGTHEIIFSYDPWSFKLGLGITLFTIALLAVGKLLSVRSPNWAGKFWRKQEQ